MRVGAGGCSGVQWVWVSVGVCGWVRECAQRAGVYASIRQCTRVYASERECTQVYRIVRERTGVQGVYMSILECCDFLILRAKPAHKPKHITI